MPTLRDPRPNLPKNWAADWITVPESRRDDLPAPLFRKQWSLPSPISSAVLHLSGQGDAEVTVNGRHPDQSRLGPGQSDHGVVARPTSVDVTELLAGQQEVVAAVELGRAFFDLHTPEVWRWSTATWRDSVRLTAELHLTLADGSQQVLTSDDSWRTSTGGTRFDSLYEGESWDADAEPEGWREPGFDDSDLGPGPGAHRPSDGRQDPPSSSSRGGHHRSAAAAGDGRPDPGARDHRSGLDPAGRWQLGR